MIWSHIFFRYELCVLAIVTFVFGMWLSLYLRFMQVRYFKHAWSNLKAKIDQKIDVGEISQAQALTLGLSGTIGIANISIVSACIIIAGPGSVFWLLLSAFFGMSIKFCEATLGQKYRLLKNNQFYIGGPMVTLDRLLNDTVAENNRFKKYSIHLISTLYTVSLICIILTFGNLFQINQLLDLFYNEGYIAASFIQYVPYALILLIVSLVWNGKFNRLAYFIARIIPLAIITYLIFSVAIIILNLDRLLDIFIIILTDAFTFKGQGYDNLFVFVIGVLLSMISHESGLGISAIAHASAKARYPVKQGFIAMLEPFIDTILICFITSIVLLMALDQGFLPVGYTAMNIKFAFEFFIPWFGSIFNLIMTLLTLSCLISCYFYLGKLIQYMININLSIYTMILYCILIYLGSKIELVNILTLIIWLVPLVIIPNILTIAMHVKEIKQDLVIYFTNLDDGFSD